MRSIRTLALLLVALALLVPALADAAGKNARQVVMAETEVSTAGGAESVTIPNPNHTSGYLLVKTADETASASLVVTVSNSSTLGDVLICTSNAITTETTTAILLGYLGNAEEGIASGNECELPAGRSVKVTFTVSGAGADFDVTADMEWVTD
jgi:hypothetical protein